MYLTPLPPAGAINPTKEGHPPAFYSTYAWLKARWVRRTCRGRTLLEVGCGDGYFLTAAQALGYEVAGVEPHRARATRTAASLHAEVRCSLLEDLDWPGARFDVIYHCDLLSHFADPVSALRKMCYFLAPDGLLAFEVGTLGGVAPFWYRWIGAVGYPQHRWLYSETGVRRLLARAGLRIEAVRHFGLAPCVVLNKCHSAAARALRLMGGGSRPGSGAPTCAASVGRSNMLTAHYLRLEQFFRYRVGVLAPRIGPGTLWIAARPLPGGSKPGNCG